MNDTVLRVAKHCMVATILRAEIHLGMLPLDHIVDLHSIICLRGDELTATIIEVDRLYEVVAWWALALVCNGRRMAKMLNQLATILRNK
jgi:hypothetical protein